MIITTTDGPYGKGRLSSKEEKVSETSNGEGRRPSLRFASQIHRKNVSSSKDSIILQGLLFSDLFLVPFSSVFQITNSISHFYHITFLSSVKLHLIRTVVVVVVGVRERVNRSQLMHTMYSTHEVLYRTVHPVRERNHDLQCFRRSRGTESCFSSPVSDPQ